MFSINQIKILELPFYNGNMNDAVNDSISLALLPKVSAVFTPNAEIVSLALKDKTFFDSLLWADILVPDGISIIKAAKILKTPLIEKIAGVELADNLLKQMAKQNLSLFILGGKTETVKKACENISNKFNVKIAGYQDGYFNNDNEAVNNINNTDASVIFVCMGAKKQELFIYKNKDKLKNGLYLGLGGSVDLFAEETKRAPDFFIKFGLEWFYRILKQPSRFKRLIPQFYFFKKVYKEKFKK